MSDTQAKIEITASTARLPAALRAAGKMVEGFAGSTTALFGSKFTNFLSGLGKTKKGETLGEKADRRSSAIGSFAGNLGANLALRGIDLLVDQGKEVLAFEEALTRFGVAAKLTPLQMRVIGNAARETSNKLGVSAIGVLDGARAYVDLAGASSFSIDKMHILARTATASGASAKDLAGVMYQLTRSMKVPDNQLEATIGGLLEQAKEGGIEATQMSAEFAGILPLFARFGTLGREGTVQAGAMFQVMRDGANSASEAGTMLQRVYASIQSYAPRFEAEGIQVYQKQRDKLGRKVLLPMAVVWKNILKSEAIKDPPRLKKIMGRTEGWRGVLLGDEATRALGTSDAAIDQHLSRLGELEAAGRVNGVVEKDLATITESSTGRMRIAFEGVKNSVADAMTPERIDTFVVAMENLASVASGVVGIFSGLVSVTNSLVELGHYIGGGDETDEKQVRDAKAKRQRERVQVLGEAYDRGQRKLHPKQTGWDELLDKDYNAKREKVIAQMIGAEEVLEGQLGTQLAGGKISRPDYGHQHAIGPLRKGEAETSYVDKGNYSMEELKALLVLTKDSTNKSKVEYLIGAIMAKQVTEALTAAIKDLGPVITGAVKGTPAPQVHIGGNNVKRSAAEARSNRTSSR